MTNEESYRMLEALRRHLTINVYEVEGKLEIVLKFTTNDGKVHQVCHSHLKLEK